MSKVTSAVIFAEYVSDEEIFEKNQPVFSAGVALAEKEQFKPIDTEVPGGYKYMEVEVLACAFNYVTVHELAEWFDGLPWATGDHAVMIMSDNNQGIYVKKHGPGIVVMEES